MAQKYGRTWWGQQWLQALDRIDFSNRLPRGKAYANAGKVVEISIEANTIRALVQGSRRNPYSVSIVAPPFTRAEKKILIETIRGNPLLIPQLLNRVLPAEILQIAERNGIRIFPKSWKDLKLTCSCPDWAVPCKHIAAVIYIVANQIDQNPFRVFSLHGFDIVKELAGEGIPLEDMETEHVYSLEEGVVRRKPSKKKKPVAGPAPDFSVIENLQVSLPMLFPASPLFYSSDFKTVMLGFYKRHVKTELFYLASLKHGVAVLPDAYRFYEYTLVAGANADLELRATDEHGYVKPVHPEKMLVLLAQTESKHLSNYSPSFITLYQTFRFCNILAERCALLPRLMRCGENMYRIQWIPALINPGVKHVFELLLQGYPPGMSMIQKTTMTRGKRVVAGYKALNPEDGLLLLCFLFTGKSAERCHDLSALKLFETTNKTDAAIIRLFFQNEAVRFNSFAGKEIPTTIQLWLKRFFIGKRDFSPVLQIHERMSRSEGVREGFEVEVLIRNIQKPLLGLETLRSFLAHHEEKQLDALKNIQLLSHYMPELERVIASGGQERLQYTTRSFSEVLTAILPVIRMLGIETLLPKSLQSLLRPKITLALKARKKNRSFFSLDDTLSFDWKIALGDQFMDVQEFKKMTTETAGLVKIRDQYISMTRDEIERIIKKLETAETPSAIELLQAALSEDYQGASVLVDPELRKQIRALSQIELIEQPLGIHAQLRPYQHRGYSWIYKNAKLGVGSLLADDMGLGKTLQVITALLKFKEEGLLDKGPALVVAPTTLLSNWENELARFAPDLRSMIYHGAGRDDGFRKVDVVISTYGVVRSDNEKLRKKHWSALIIDEAQNIKNNSIALTKAVKMIPSTIRIAMTGTPVENRLGEYWSIFDFVNPRYLGTENWFNSNFAQGIELNQDKHLLDKFLKITAPFILRRVKTDKAIIADLPDKIENNQYCHLSKEQAALYKNLTTDLLQGMEDTAGIQRRGLILKLFTVLKQICNHPAQYLKTEAEAAPEQSGKMLLLFQLLETIYENNEKVLIFSQYKEAGDILQQVIQTRFGKKALQLHGGSTRKDRDDMVKAFQENPMHDTFILSLKAGGTGLNLTAGNHVIHYDLWWNPATEAQATDRAFRIGQLRNVMVHRLITKGTLEERIDEMLKTKKSLANLTIAGGEKWVGELSDQEIRELVSLVD